MAFVMMAIMYLVRYVEKRNSGNRKGEKSNEKRKTFIFKRYLMGLMLLFFYLPIGFMIVFSFNSSKSLTHFTGFSMQWYTKMLSDAS